MSIYEVWNQNATPDKYIPEKLAICSEQTKMNPFS